MRRRTFLVAAVGCAAGLGGCLGRQGSPSTPDRADGPLVVSGEGEYPHEISVDNSRDREVTLTIALRRGGTTLYREAHAVAAGSTAVVAGITRESLPDGSRSVTVSATTAGGETTEVDVAVSGCLGDVVFYYESDGTLRSTYSIC